jgi:hypothetical protein
MKDKKIKWQLEPIVKILNSQSLNRERIAYHFGANKKVNALFTAAYH